MVPLNVHSYYTMMEGTIPVDGLIEKARSAALPALALTDTDGMYGLIEFSKKAYAADIKPLLGACITEPLREDIYALMLAKNLEGYADLCRIITTRKLDKNFTLFKLLRKELKNIVVLTPSLELLQGINTGGSVYAELISTEKLKGRTRRLYEYALSKGIKFAASAPVYFMEPEDYLLHRVVTAIRKRETLGTIKDAALQDGEFYFKDPAELDKLWRKLPAALNSVQDIVNMCSVDLQIGKYKFPEFQPPQQENPYSYLWKLAFEGLERRYPKITDIERDRLKFELEVIFELHLADYFLVVWDIVREAKRRGMMLIGRGSAANSLVSYCLGFTEVDPIKYNLYFERFLNKSRSSPPDVDLDFSWKERDEIVKYVFNKYGYERVAMISTHVTMQARSAFRETAKVFGFSDEEISKISRYIPWTSAKNLPNLAQLYPEAKALTFSEEPWKSIVTLAARLSDAPRHLSIHPGGIVISPKPITNYTALEYAKNKGIGIIVTQPDMYGIEDMGLVKIDLLSQRSLGVLRDAMKDIEGNISKEV